MPVLTEIQQLNRELGDKVLADAQQNPQAFPRKYVGIANGQIDIVTDDLDDLVRCLDQADPNAANTFWVEVGCDYTKICEIWGMS